MTGETFKQWRLSLNYSQEDMARYMGLHPMTISRWERRKDQDIPKPALRKCQEFYLSMQPKAVEHA